MIGASGRGPDGSGRGGAWVLPAILLAALVVAAYVKPLWTRENFVGQDILAYNLPLEKAVHDALSRGRLPVWSEDVSGGRPLFPNPNSGSLFPVRPLLALLPFPVAMRIFPVAHWVLAGVGALLLSRALRASGGAAWICAATYIFSGVMVSEVYYTTLQPGAALLPWTLWAMVRPGSAHRKAVALGLTYGLLFLGGDVVSASIAVLAAVLWIVLETARAQRGREFGALGLGLLLGGLLAAPQIVATASLVAQTQRAVSGIRLGEALGYSLSPWRLLELVIPYPWGATWAFDDAMNWGHAAFRCFYATLFCGALPVLGLLGSRAQPRVAGQRCVLALFLASLGLAVGGGLLPRVWSAWSAPIPLRYPEKFVLGATLAMAIAAGIAWDRSLRSARSPTGLLAVVAGLALLAGAARMFPREAGSIAAAAVGAPPESITQAGAELPGALALAGLLWAASWVGLQRLRSPGRFRLAGAAALLTAVPFAATRCIPRTASEGAVFPPTRFARTIDRRDPLRQFRTMDESLYRPATPTLERSLLADPYHVELQRQSWYCHTPAIWARGVIFNADLDRGDLSRLDTLRRVSSQASRDGDGTFFAALGLRFGIRFRDQAALPGFAPFGGDAFRIWDENRSALPSIRLLQSWREEASGVDALRALPDLQPGEVVLETGRQARGSAPPGAVRVVESSPEQLILDVDAPQATWLFIVRGYWEHRTVRVDGREVDGVPAQLAFSAVPIEAGRHRIQWREEIPGGTVSVAGPPLCVLLSALLWLPGRRRAT
ncbi:MAG: hypothetical protein ABI968_06775 [Acidobacteriota bacterium]